MSNTRTESERKTVFMVRATRDGKTRYLQGTKRSRWRAQKPRYQWSVYESTGGFAFETETDARRRLRCHALKDERRWHARIEVVEVVTYKVTEITVKHTTADAITKLGLLAEEAS